MRREFYDRQYGCGPDNHETLQSSGRQRKILVPSSVPSGDLIDPREETEHFNPVAETVVWSHM